MRSTDPLGRKVETGRLPRRMPRWKRLQRALLLTLLSASLGYFGCIFLAGAWMKHDLANLEDSIRVKGEPVTLEELDSFYPKVPDAENAALAYKRAGETLAYFHPEQEYDLEGSRLESDLKSADYTYETLTHLKDYIGERRPVFEILDEALQFEKARYPVDLSKLPRESAVATRTLRGVYRLLWLQGINAIHGSDWETLAHTVQNLTHLRRTLEQAPDTGFQMHCQVAFATTCDLVSRVIRTQRAPASLHRTLEALLQGLDWRTSMRMDIIANRVYCAARMNAFYRNDPTAFGEDDLKLFEKYQPYRSIPGFQTWGLIEKRSGVRFYTEVLDNVDKSWPVIFAGMIERNSFPDPFRFLEPIAERFDPVDLGPYEPNDYSIFCIDGEAIIRLTRIAIRIDAHRAEHGAYPNSINELQWEIPSEIATGPYFDNSFGYRKTENGFALFDDSIYPENYGGLYARKCEIKFARETPPLPMKAADPKPPSGIAPSQLPQFRRSS